MSCIILGDQLVSAVRSAALPPRPNTMEQMEQLWHVPYTSARPHTHTHTQLFLTHFFVFVFSMDAFEANVSKNFFNQIYTPQQTFYWCLGLCWHGHQPDLASWHFPQIACWIFWFHNVSWAQNSAQRLTSHLMLNNFAGHGYTTVNDRP